MNTKFVDKQEVINIVDILSHNITNSAAADSLGSRTVAVINSDFGTGLLQSFLMKKAHLMLWAEDFVAGETVIVGIARGDATITEIKTALETAQLERDMQDQANVRVVLLESLGIVGVHAPAGEGAIHTDLTFSVGGGKGIPFENGDGWQLFAYNPSGNAISNATQFIQGVATYYGVWL